MLPSHVLKKALLLLALASAAVPGRAYGQTPGEVRVVGRVIDDVTGRPLGDAQVTARAADGRFLARVETGDDGTFELNLARVSAVRIDVRRLSYRAAAMPLLHFDGRRFMQVEARLDPEAILLAPLEVIAWSEVDPSPMLDAFRFRVRTGQGVYITREEIEARRPTFVVDLLREIPGVTVTGSGPGNRASVSMGRAQSMALMGGACEAQIYVDGFLMNRRLAGRGAPADVRIDDMVSPLSVEGIEVYRGLSTVPAEFLNPDARCGVVAIWTRRGDRR